MRAVLVDDEHLALNYLEYQLKQFSNVNIVGQYQDPMAAKLHIIDNDVDVVFLDIHLPEMHGIELAEQLLEVKPALQIVFVTAYDDYAIKAFELNAIDYVMKPVQTERISNTLQRINLPSPMPPVNPSMESHSIRMKLFRQVLIETEPHQFTAMNWRTTKAQELFFYLVQFRGQLVRKSTLIELLWPDFEYSKACSQLYTTIYHIRKTLRSVSQHFTIRNVSHGYLLEMDNVILDIDEWQSFMMRDLPITEETIDAYESHMLLYSGDYLQAYDYVWVESERQRLKMIWLRYALKIAKWYAESDQLEKAIDAYHNICEHHPLAEEAHFELMKLYAADNNHVSVHCQYRLLTICLQKDLNEKPSPYIVEWYQQWKGLPE